jgi:hypothetical protein
MDFYVYRDNQLEGPYTARQLHDMVVAKELNPELLCAPDGAQEWKTISEVLSPVLPEKEEIVAEEDTASLNIARSALVAQALGFLSLLCLGMVVLHRQMGFYTLAALALPAVMCGAWALVQIRKQGPATAGNGLALGGMIAAVASLLVGAWLAFSVLPAGIPELDNIPPEAGAK